MTTSETLRAAAQYIREHGWRRQWYGRHGGPRCMLGALWSANPESAYRDEWGRILMDVCGCRAADFNDKYCKSADDAIAALEIAADLAEPSP